MNARIIISLFTTAFITILLAGCPAPLATPGGGENPPATVIERVSLTAAGTEGNCPSTAPVTSADGRYVAFLSTASNLLPGDNNLIQDAFVYDRETDTIEQVNVSAAGVRADSHCFELALSADGRFVAFMSAATNLTPGDANGIQDIFVKNRQTGAVEIVSTDAAGNQSDDASWSPALSADGRFVAFQSLASNLAAGDANNSNDIFVKDRQTGAVELVSMSSTAVQGNYSSQAPALSEDGRYVAFNSSATNLVAGDTNAATDVFVYDRQTDTIERVSVNSGGVQADKECCHPALSGDGRYVAFESTATNLAPGAALLRKDIFVKDRQTGAVERVSVGPAGVMPQYSSEAVSLSADGRYAAYQSASSNLVAGDTNGAVDVFVFDRQTDGIVWSSAFPAGRPTDGASTLPAISADGRWVAVQSAAANLVIGDTNGWDDVFAGSLP